MIKASRRDSAKSADLVTDEKFRRMTMAGKSTESVLDYVLKHYSQASERNVQRAMKAIRDELHQAVDSDIEDEDDEVDTSKITADEIQRRHLARVQAENKKWRDKSAASSEIIEAIRDEFKALPVIKVTPPASVRRKHGMNLHKPRSLVLHLSDIHVGQLFSRMGSGGLGEYDLRVFEERANRLSSKVLALHQDLSYGGPVEKLVIVFNGDMIDGREIHPGHSMQSVGMGAQLRVGPEVIAQALIAPLAESFKEIEIFATPGNHGRIGKKGDLDKVEDSLDLVFMDILKLRCGNMKNVKWHAWDKWFAWFELHGHTYFCAHGDAFKSWLGIPFYGLSKYKSRIESLINRPIDVMMVGHHHSPAHWNTAFSHCVLNGSWVGTSRFGAEIGMGGPPVQKLVLVSEDYACATTYDLVLAKNTEVLTAKPIVIN